VSRALFILSYDISDDRRRRLLSRKLESVARRVQESLFETYASAGDVHQVISDCERFVRVNENDSLRVYKISWDTKGCFFNLGGPVFDWETDIVI
jgi:CRISPR-associated protein Cas2